MPLVSVIIPTYNRIFLLERAIKSVMAQSFQNFEIIIVDDNSIENIEPMIEKFKDNRIKYYKHLNNFGPAVARNTGIKNSVGDLLAFLDDDDEWFPNKLEAQVEKFSELSADFGLVYVQSAIYKQNKKVNYLPYTWLKKKEGSIFRHLLKLNFIDTPATMIRREVIDSVGLFDEELHCLEDYDLFLRIARKYKICFIKEPLLVSHYTPGGVNEKNIINHIETLIKITTKYLKEYEKQDIILANRYLIIADLYYLANDVINSSIYFRKSLKLNNTDLKTVVLFWTSMMLGNKLKVLYLKIRSIVIRLNYLMTGKSGLY